MGEYNAKNVYFFGKKKQTPPFEGMDRIYSNFAEFVGPSVRTLFRGPGNTGL